MLNMHGPKRDVPLLGSLDRTQRMRQMLEPSPESAFNSPFFQESYEVICQLLESSFEPEASRLRRVQEAAETDGTSEPPHGFLGEGKTQTPSMFLYGEELPEINRTFTGVLMLVALVKGDYLTFSDQSKQPSSPPLTKRSFLAMRKQLLQSIFTPFAVWALIVSIVINDLGKDPQLIKDVASHFQRLKSVEGSLSPQIIKDIETFLQQDWELANHDMTLSWAAQLGLVEIIADIPDQPQQSVKLGIRVGATLNLAQLAQLENVPGSLMALGPMKGNQPAFMLKFWEIVFDVCGANGHMDSRCALAMCEPVWQSYNGVREILVDFIKTVEMSPIEAYNKVQRRKLEMLVPLGFQDLDLNDPVQFTLSRLLGNGRADANMQLAMLLQRAFQALSGATRKRLVEGMSVDGLGNTIAVIPGYFPALLANIRRIMNGATNDELQQAFTVVLTIVSNIFSGDPVRQAPPGRIFECELKFLADSVKEQNSDVLAFLEGWAQTAIPDKAYREVPACY